MRLGQKVEAVAVSESWFFYWLVFTQLWPDVAPDQFFIDIERSVWNHTNKKIQNELSVLCPRRNKYYWKKGRRNLSDQTHRDQSIRTRAVFKGWEVVTILIPAKERAGGRRITKFCLCHSNGNNGHRLTERGETLPEDNFYLSLRLAQNFRHISFFKAASQKHVYIYVFIYFFGGGVIRRNDIR